MRTVLAILLIGLTVGGCGGGGSSPGADLLQDTLDTGADGRVDTDLSPREDNIPDKDSVVPPDMTPDMEQDVLSDSLVEPDETDTSDLEEVDTCVPSCADKECGDDGCGGDCGSCDLHFACDDSVCVVQPWCGDGSCDEELDEDCSTCPADCACKCGETCSDGLCSFTACDGRDCGDDGCGGLCGECTGPQDVCLQGLCTCTPACEDRECGADGCGGTCGSCGPYEECGGEGVCGSTIGLVWKSIPGGTFAMGRSPADNLAADDERPTHTVVVSGFAMLQSEITQAQFEAVMGYDPSCNKDGESGANKPVECVTWEEARTFCETVGGRLPTEAEWEYAARAGSTTRTYCGDDIECLASVAWYYIEDATWYKRDVMLLAQNDFGLYDMLGNVQEWVNDWFDPNYYANGPMVNPTGPETGTKRISRGGSFDYYPEYLRASYREYWEPTVLYYDQGFRCAMSTPCVASCESKACGDDGCGGSCGVCSNGTVCNLQHQCASLQTDWVTVPGGALRMGRSLGEEIIMSDIEPPHVVQVPTFQMMVYEVTEQQFQAVMGTNPSGAECLLEEQECPVESVSWSQADQFCKAIGGRLPTEAEWEHAARAGVNESTYCGSYDCVGDIAWVYDESDVYAKHSVGNKPCNDFGICDIIGNVEEWTNDWYQEDYYKVSPVHAPSGPESGTEKVVRGGSYGSFNYFYSNASYRKPTDPLEGVSELLGFRCVRDVECVPQCEGKECGFDGCNGSCGTCPEGEFCYPDAHCAEVPVVWLEIPGGTFTMGCSPGDAECRREEFPPHQVTVPPFSIMMTEVTEWQYEAVMGINPSYREKGQGGDDHPVEGMTWYEADAFCRAIGGELPTEAAWEYAARGGTTTKYPCGDDPTCIEDTDWHVDNSGLYKHPVGQLAPNGYGLLDVLGNVAEFTSDWHEWDYYTLSTSNNPHGPTVGTAKSSRGCTFYCGTDPGVSVRWGYDAATKASAVLGIRCIKDLPCTPDCKLRDCGSDGCGGSCGTCAQGDKCSDAGACVNAAGLTWHQVPAGVFSMGCDAETSCPLDALPLHQVSMSAFEITETEITEAQFSLALGYNPSCHYYYAEGPDYPVECVTFNEARMYCEMFGGDLPTEAQWEYAARAGTQGTTYCEEDSFCEKNHAWTSASTETKQRVRRKVPNALGLFDMVGNVAEWCSDRYNSTYYQTSPAQDPWNALGGTLQVIRGGGFRAQGDVFTRSNDAAGPLGDDLGFRCVRVLY